MISFTPLFVLLFLAGALGVPLAAALGGGATVLLAAGYALGVPRLRKFSLNLKR